LPVPGGWPLRHHRDRDVRVGTRRGRPGRGRRRPRRGPVSRLGGRRRQGRRRRPPRKRRSGGRARDRALPARPGIRPGWVGARTQVDHRRRCCQHADEDENTAPPVDRRGQGTNRQPHDWITLVPGPARCEGGYRVPGRSLVIAIFLTGHPPAPNGEAEPT
jgi:hypothetical protein